METTMKNVRVRLKPKKIEVAELEAMSKQELITRIVQLETHNQQLRNVIKKGTQQQASSEPNDRPNKREFDFSKIHRRHIMLRFFYLGWDYQGFAEQEDSIATIEHHVFRALTKTCLIESRANSNYHRCGRTDKGVSAFHQVISIDVRSKFPEAEQMTEPALESELDYCKLLNRVLPADIRCVSWMPLRNPKYSARFDCKRRTYRYFFPRGDLNITAMREGCQYIIGSHDFRNFCKMDVANGVVSFIRELFSAEIKACEKDQSNESPFDMLFVELAGKAFLWHQVRCIMAVLLLIGEGHEEPIVMKEMLDVSSNPEKPQYSLSSDIPLNLFACDYMSVSCNEPRKLAPGSTEIDISPWIYNRENLSYVINGLQGQWTIESVKASMIKSMVEVLTSINDTKFKDSPIVQSHADILMQGVRSKQYIKLMERKKCASLENRVKHYVKKRRLDADFCTESATLDTE